MVLKTGPPIRWKLFFKRLGICALIALVLSSWLHQYEEHQSVSNSASACAGNTSEE